MQNARTKKQSRHYFLAAGWASFLYAFLILPHITFSIIADSTTSTAAHTVKAILSAVFILLLSFQLLTLKEIIHRKAAYGGLDSIIDMIIIINVILFPFQALFDFQMFQTVISLVILVFYIPKGILLITFGIKLQNIQDNMPQETTWISLLLILCGICYVTVLLHLIGIVIYLIISIIFGFLFFSYNPAKNTKTGKSPSKPSQNTI